MGELQQKLSSAKCIKKRKKVVKLSFSFNGADGGTRTHPEASGLITNQL